MAGRDGQGEGFSPGSRKRDRTVDDALRTMERLSQWLEMAGEQDVWRQMDDPLQVAMLHGMLVHLQEEIEQMLASGGEEVEATIKALRTLSYAGRGNGENGELVGAEGAQSLNRRTSTAQEEDGRGG